MIMFNSDYLEGAHACILERLTETNMEQTPGYGEDYHCERARKLIQAAVGDENAYVQFLVGGTQTNQTVLASLLRPHEGVIAPETGHIACHETGAIEATGHKVITLPAKDGKITAEAVAAYAKAHREDPTHEHIVKPKAVFIAFATEEGTLYTKEELTALHHVCREYGLILYMDGARLGYGLMSEACDLSLKDIYALTDVFYIGGTKVGALFGEAVVMRPETPHEDFRYLIKQHGGMLAKGRLLGIQFEALMEPKKDKNSLCDADAIKTEGGSLSQKPVETDAAPSALEDVSKNISASKQAADCLYFEIAAHADRLAMKLREGVRRLGYRLYRDSFTNQQFVILPDAVLEKLQKDFSYSGWGRASETESVVRLCTSWATKEADVDAFLRALEEMQS